MKQLKLKSCLVLALAALPFVTSCKPQSAVQSSTQSSVAAGIDDSRMSPELKSFRDAFLNVSKGDDLAAMLDVLDKGYDAAPNDLKFFSAQLIALKPWRSIVYRSATLVTQSQAIHSAFLSGMMAAASSIKNSYDIPAMQALFEFLTEPDGVSKQFASVSELQDFIMNTNMPALTSCAERLENVRAAANAPIVFDRRLVYGATSFQDNLDRYSAIQPSDIDGVLASMHLQMHSAIMYSSYNFDDALSLAEDFGKAVGYEEVRAPDAIHGFPAKSRVAILMGSKYQNSFLLKDSMAPVVATAFDHLKRAVELTRSSWNGLSQRPDSDADILNAAFFRPVRSATEKQLKAIEAMVAGPTQLHSFVSGQVVTVNLPAVYAKPVKDLKALLPTDFWDGGEFLTKNGTQYRNYRYGMGIAWNAATYNTFFPDLNSGGQVREARKVLAETLGGWFADMPFSALAF